MRLSVELRHQFIFSLAGRGGRELSARKRNFCLLRLTSPGPGRLFILLKRQVYQWIVNASVTNDIVIHVLNTKIKLALTIHICCYLWRLLFLSLAERQIKLGYVTKMSARKNCSSHWLKRTKANLVRRLWRFLCFLYSWLWLPLLWQNRGVNWQNAVITDSMRTASAWSPAFADIVVKRAPGQWTLKHRSSRSLLFNFHKLTMTCCLRQGGS